MQSQGQAVFGQSSTFLNSVTYANLRAAVVADAKSASDTIAIGAGWFDGTSGSYRWHSHLVVSTAQAKALGLTPIT